MRQKVKYSLIKLGYFSEPSFVIGGVQKGGTTILYSFLKMHPQIIEPGYKEAHFFDTENYKKGKREYVKNFFLPYKYNYGQITFDATPDYVYYPWVPERISSYYPNMQFIFVLRDPVERAFSAWNMHHTLFKEKKVYRHLYDPRSFEEAIKNELAGDLNNNDVYSYLNRGIYSEQLARYYSVFGRHNIMITTSDSLKKDTQVVLNKAIAFLGLDAFTFEKNKKDTNFWENKGKYKETLSVEIKDKLQIFFRPWNISLEEITGQKFYWFDHD